MNTQPDSRKTTTSAPCLRHRTQDRAAAVAIVAAGVAVMLVMWLTPHHKAHRPAGDRIAYQPRNMQAAGVLLPPVSTLRAADGLEDGGYGWDGVPAPQPRDHARETQNYTTWRIQFQSALSTLEKRGFKAQADDLRRWFHSYQSHEAMRCVAGEGPAASISTLFDSPSVQRLISRPPVPAFERFYGYKVVLPWNRAVYYYKGNQMKPGTPYLLHEKGIADSGTPARLREGIEKLFREAGIRDSVVRNVLLRVSAREGGFDAVNTWDTGYVSVGFIQFTTGEGASGRSLVRVLQRMKDDEKGRPDGEFERFFSSHGIDVNGDELFVRDPSTGEIKSGQDGVRLIIDDKRLIAIFQDAGRRSRAFQIAQIREAHASYYLAGKFFRIPVTRIDSQVNDEPVRSHYVYGDEALRIAANGPDPAPQAETVDNSAGSPLPIIRTAKRLPDLIARYSDVLYSEGAKVALTDRAVQRGVKNASQTFVVALAEVAEGLPPNLKAIRARQDQIVALLKNRIDVSTSMEGRKELAAAR